MLGRFLLLGVGYVLSLVVFQSGFLLKRHELPFYSSCDDVVASFSAACWIRPTFKRAIWIVVDALRHDFVDPNVDGRDVPGSTYFQHQMPNLENMIRTQPENTLFSKFIADPPTTTLQRLKGLTSGSLPTFIDAGANFAATSIGEDNVIDQLRSTGRNITFLGDDTWVSLYPTQFHRSFDLPSFDINDLHSVDDMVLKHLFSELERPDWQLLIAHFLGVDHCGHKYGPDHPEMRMKLRQMDSVIENITKHLDEDTVLFVMGDHGMTATGDHGGDSAAETVAAFVAYSKQKIVWNKHSRRNIYQVDFVPTLSLLLDFPIPFSNVGRLIEEFFSSSNLVKASKSNCWQMVRFVQSYVEKQPHLKPVIDFILRDFENGEENDVERNAAVMRRLQEVLREAWTSFDMALMRVGLISFVDCLVYHLYLMANRSNHITVASIAIRSGVILLQLAVVLGNQARFIVNALDMILASSVVYYLVLTLFTWTHWITTGRTATAVFLLFYCLSMSSNSFVVYESTVLRFMIQTFILVSIYENLVLFRRSNRKNLSSLRDFLKTFISSNTLKWLLVASVLIRICSTFERCREEQVECEPTFFSGNLQAVPDDNKKMVRFILGITSIFATNFAFYRFDNSRNRDSVLSELSFASSWVSMGAISLYWMLQLLPDAVFQSFKSFSLRCAQLVYVIAIFNCALKLKNAKDYKSLVIGTIYSISPALIIILGDGVALPLVGLMITCIFLNRVISNDVHRFVLLFLLSLYGFFALSHHPILSAIPWQAAFVGIPGNFSIQAIPAFLVLLHIFASHFLVSFTLPLSMSLHPQKWIFEYLLVNAFKSFAVAGTAFVQRRHLMVWKIFAPKFIFDAISLIVVVVTLSVALILLKLKPLHRYGMSS